MTGRSIIIGGVTFNRIVMESHDYINGRLVRRQTAPPPPQEDPVYLNTVTGRYVRHGTRTYFALTASDFDIVEDYYLVPFEEEELIEAIIWETSHNDELRTSGRRLTFNEIQDIRTDNQAYQDEYDDLILQQGMANGIPSGPPRTLADHAPRLAELNIELCKECLMPVNPSDLTDRLCNDCASS